MCLMAVANVIYVIVPVIHVFLSCHLLYAIGWNIMGGDDKSF